MKNKIPCHCCKTEEEEINLFECVKCGWMYCVSCTVGVTCYSCLDKCKAHRKGSNRAPCATYDLYRITAQ